MERGKGKEEICRFRSSVGLFKLKLSILDNGIEILPPTAIISFQEAESKTLTDFYSECNVEESPLKIEEEYKCPEESRGSFKFSIEGPKHVVLNLEDSLEDTEVMPQAPQNLGERL